MRNTIAAGKADNACQVLRLMLLMTKTMMMVVVTVAVTMRMTRIQMWMKTFEDPHGTMPLAAMRSASASTHMAVVIDLYSRACCWRCCSRNDYSIF